MRKNTAEARKAAMQAELDARLRVHGVRQPDVDAIAPYPEIWHEAHRSHWVLVEMRPERIHRAMAAVRSRADVWWPCVRRQPSPDVVVATGILPGAFFVRVHATDPGKAIEAAFGHLRGIQGVEVRAASVVVSETEVERFRRSLDKRQAAAGPTLGKGARVRIAEGHFAGLEFEVGDVAGDAVLGDELQKLFAAASRVTITPRLLAILDDAA